MPSSISHLGHTLLGHITQRFIRAYLKDLNRGLVYGDHDGPVGAGDVTNHIDDDGGSAGVKA